MRKAVHAACLRIALPAGQTATQSLPPDQARYGLPTRGKGLSASTRQRPSAYESVFTPRTCHPPDAPASSLLYLLLWPITLIPAPQRPRPDNSNTVPTARSSAIWVHPPEARACQHPRCKAPLPMKVSSRQGPADPKKLLLHRCCTFLSVLSPLPHPLNARVLTAATQALPPDQARYGLPTRGKGLSASTRQRPSAYESVFTPRARHPPNAPASSLLYLLVCPITLTPSPQRPRPDSGNTVPTAGSRLTPPPSSRTSALRALRSKPAAIRTASHTTIPSIFPPIFPRHLPLRLPSPLPLRMHSSFPPRSPHCLPPCSVGSPPAP